MNFDIRFDPPWMSRMRAEVGVTEIPGPGSLARIEQYHASTAGGIATDDVAWCSSCLCFVMEESGILSPKSKASHAWRNWGIQIPGPLVGAVAFFDHGGGKGHVTLVAGRGPNRTVACIGGNQSDQVKMTFYSYDKITSFRWPDLPLLTPAAPVVAESTR